MPGVEGVPRVEGVPEVLTLPSLLSFLRLSTVSYNYFLPHNKRDRHSVELHVPKIPTLGQRI